jgi:hypothetical protein
MPVIISVCGMQHVVLVRRVLPRLIALTHRISSDMETLHVKGIIVDRVTTISDKFPHYALENQARWHEKVRDMLTQWRISTQKCLNIGFEESIIDILFAATCIAEELADKISQTNRFEKVCLEYSYVLLASAILS